MAADKRFLTIPDGRGLIRLDTIESVCLFAPRVPFTDEITGRLCGYQLLVETRRCVHRFNFERAADAKAVVEQAGLAFAELETLSPYSDGPGLPPLPSAFVPRAVNGEARS